MNRAVSSSALIMKPRQQFLDWLMCPEINAQLTDDKRNLLATLNLEIMRANATIISMPLLTAHAEEESEKFMSEHAAEMIAAEFLRWSIPLELRPAEVDVTLLKEWFDISYHSKIFSLE